MATLSPSYNQHEDREEGKRRDMQTAQFENWLWNVAGLSRRTVGARLSNCKRLEHYEGDLDEHFDADGMAYLLGRLVYTTTDERDGAPTQHRIPIYGNRRTGTATLKSAAVLYREFRKSLAAPLGSSNARDETMRRRQRSSLSGEATSSATGHRMGVFESWLQDHTELSLGSIGSYVANCKRLERYEGDLDAHFDSDGMASLLARLSYSTFDERRGVWPRHSVPIGGDLRNGTATLKSRATLYRDFLQRQRRADTVGIRQPKTASNEARQAHRNVRKYLIYRFTKRTDRLKQLWHLNAPDIMVCNERRAIQKAVNWAADAFLDDDHGGWRVVALTELVLATHGQKH